MVKKGLTGPDICPGSHYQIRQIRKYRSGSDAMYNVLHTEPRHSALNGSIRDSEMDKQLEYLHFHSILQIIEFLLTIPHTGTDYKLLDASK
jgi:hypothetical protein